jgi:hypothetical protein
MFLVAKYDGSKAWGGAAYGTGANNQTFGLVVRHPTGTLTLQGWGSGNDLVSSTMGIGAGWLVQSGVLNAGTGTLYKDGVQIKQWSHTYNTVLTKVVIGEEIKNLGFMDMDVAAVLIYNRALDSVERASVEAYLTGKYVQEGSPSLASMAVIPNDPQTGLELGIISHTPGWIRLEFPELSAAGDYHLYAVGSLNPGEPITEIRNRIHTITRKEVQSMSLDERQTVTLELPVDGESRFFQLLFEVREQ